MTGRRIGEVLEWDSEFFGVPIGRVRARTLTPEDALRVQEWARDHALRCLYFLVDANDSHSIHAAEEIGFRHMDVRMTRGRALEGESGPKRSPKTARAEDLPALLELARRSHRATRFYHDPNFPDERCDELYARWVQRGFERANEEVVVACSTGRPIGYMVCSDSGSGCGHLGLMAVAPDARRTGLGRVLSQGAMAWLSSRGCDRAEVVTQGRNTAANRLFERLGFLTLRMEHWLHLWLEERP